MKDNSICAAFFISCGIGLGFASGVGIYLGLVNAACIAFTSLLNAF